MKTKFSLIFLVAILICSTSTALAASTTSTSITPRIIPEEWEYHEDRQYFNEEWDFEHEARNGKGVNDKVTYNVSRTLSTSLNVTGSVEAGVIFSKVGIDTEVGIGKTKTESTTAEYTIPKNTITLCKYGSAHVNTKGYLHYYFNGKLSSKTYVRGDWSYRSVSDSYVIDDNYTGPTQN